MVLAAISACKHSKLAAWKAEYVTLEYQNDAKLYIACCVSELDWPLFQVVLKILPLHKLGGEAWQKARKRAAEKVRDVAAELLRAFTLSVSSNLATNLYWIESIRNLQIGLPIRRNRWPSDGNQCCDVPAMCQAKMDRLVCGDVGFGKTEVAMRAAFVCTGNDKQVAVLVPTTLLAQRHARKLPVSFRQLADSCWGSVSIQIRLKSKS